MTISKKVREKVFEILKKDYSPEKIVDFLTKDSEWNKEDIPTAKTIRNWLNKGSNIQESVLTKEVKQHDKRVFKESDDILNENQLDTLIHRLLVGNRFYNYEAEMLGKYLAFSRKESNKYVIPNLKKQGERCNKMMKRLSYFLEIHSDIIADDSRGIKYKLYPGGDANRFYKYLTNDHTRTKAEERFNKKVDRLAIECQDAYKKYRSHIRETLIE